MTKLFKMKAKLNMLRITKFDAEQISDNLMILKIWDTSKEKRTYSIKALKDNYNFDTLVWDALLDKAGEYSEFRKVMYGAERYGEIEVNVLNIENI